jgi:prefoldin subunit 5
MSESMTQSFRYWRVRRDLETYVEAAKEAAVLARLKAKLEALRKQEEELQDEISTITDCIDELEEEE